MLLRGTFKFFSFQDGDEVPVEVEQVIRRPEVLLSFEGSFRKVVLVKDHPRLKRTFSGFLIPMK